MGIRNKVVKDGFVSTSVDGDTGFFGFEQSVITGATPTALTTGLAVLSGALVTASLPSVSTTVASDGTVANGIVCTVVLGSADTFLLSASVPINGGAWTRQTVGAASASKVLTCVGVTGLSSAAPIQWLVSSGSVI